MKSFNEEHAELLYTRFCIIYDHKFVKPYHSEDYKTLWYKEWTSGLTGVDVSVIAGALEHCKLNLDWPPSIAEFRRLCEKASGIPSCRDCFESSIRGEHSHPLAYLTYTKVGSWAMRNDKDEVLQKKYASAYEEALVEYRANPEKAQAFLEANQEKPKELPFLDKPTPDEITGFKERMVEYQTLARLEKEKRVDGHPVWDKGEVTRGSKSFNESVYNERKRYLLGLTEYEAGSLPVVDWYDRTKYLREIEAAEHLKTVGYNPSPPPEPKKRPGGKGYVKDWMMD